MLILALASSVYAQQRDLAGDLAARVSQSCPIVGVSIGSPADKATWAITPQPGATAGQISAAQSVVTTFDTTPYAAVPMRRGAARRLLYQERCVLDTMNEELSNDPGNAAIQADITAQQNRIAALRALAKQ